MQNTETRAANKKTIDYDPTRDNHLKRFFDTPSMREHMRHASELDRISDRRNPWNDALEYLMDAGSAYSVRAIFDHNNHYAHSNNNKAASASSSSQQGNFRPPQPPSNTNNNSSSKKSSHQHRPHSSKTTTTSTSNNNNTSGIRSGSARAWQERQAATKSKYRSESSSSGQHKLPPLPRFNSALRNIRRFDDEVHRILSEGSRTEHDKKEQERWNRMQQRMKVERMIRQAQSPEFHRRDEAYHGKQSEQQGGEQNVNDKENAGKKHTKHSSASSTTSGSNQIRSLAPRSRRYDNDDDDNYDDEEEYIGEDNYDEENELDSSVRRSNDNDSSSRHGSGRRGSRQSGTSSYYQQQQQQKRKQSSIVEQEEQEQEEEEQNQQQQFSSSSNSNKIPGWVTWAITRFQANCIGWMVRNRLSRARDACIIIQRSFRDHLTNRGVTFAIRMLQRAGRAMKIRVRLFLLMQRSELWNEAKQQHEQLTQLCIRLHRSTGIAAKCPVQEASEREKLEKDCRQTATERGFEVTAGELRRRAILTCVAPKGNLRRESFRRLLDDDDETDVPHTNEMKGVETPAVLVPVLQEIEEEEPVRRGDSEEPLHSPIDNNNTTTASANENDNKNKTNKSPSSGGNTPVRASTPSLPSSPNNKNNSGNNSRRSSKSSIGSRKNSNMSDKNNNIKNKNSSSTSSHNSSNRSSRSGSVASRGSGKNSTRSTPVERKSPTSSSAVVDDENKINTSSVVAQAAVQQEHQQQQQHSPSSSVSSENQSPEKLEHTMDTTILPVDGTEEEL